MNQKMLLFLLSYQLADTFISVCIAMKRALFSEHTIGIGSTMRSSPTRLTFENRERFLCGQNPIVVDELGLV